MLASQINFFFICNLHKGHIKREREREDVKMGKKDKKKGKGAEKTAAKTKKKSDQKLKKALASKGEEDIESLLANFVEETRKQNAIKEVTVQPPSKRSSFTLTAHPDKDQLILFGGEYFNGIKTFVYNDLYFYKIKQGAWMKISGPVEPPPRCSHQAVAMPQNGGELWIFGGEFTSPSQSQFYHFKDLWVYRFATKTWEKVAAKGSSPSARSGHRMVAVKRKLALFGGYRDNTRDYKYFNDVFLFDTETYTWHSVDALGSAPSPRSGCQMLATMDGRVIIYGGYSKEKLKKDVEKGVVHSEMFCLAPDKHDETGLKWKWVLLKPGGLRPSPRCAFSMCLSSPDKAVLFGGVDDTEEESELEGSFFNDLHTLDLDKLRWHEIELKGRKIESGSAKGGEKAEDQCEISSKLNELNLEQTPPETVVSDDGIFTVSVKPPHTSSDSNPCSSSKIFAKRGFAPPERMSAGVAVKRGILYLYGGIYEEGDKQLTLNDFYSLDLTKFDEWKTLIGLDRKDQEWFDSASESESGTGGESESEAEDQDEESE